MSWQLDSSHTQIHFSVKHMMISTVRGQFNSFTAEAEIDPSDFSKSSVVATAEVASISTGEAQRDGHLRSADFFDGDNHPTLTLKSRKVTKKGDDVTVEADLTIRGITQPITLQGELTGPLKDPWGNERVGFSVTGELEREKFDLKWNQALEAGGVLVGKKVKLELEGEFIKK